MTEDEAIAIANDYIALRLGPNPKLAGEPCAFELMGTKHKANSLTVLYTITMLASPDDVVDGPIIVVVDTTSKEAKFFIVWLSDEACRWVLCRWPIALLPEP